TLEGDTVVAEEILFTELDQRIRDIRVSPDGLLYIITDGAQGQVVRVSPK
ncbi:MAG TPA: glucose dehydrogenase, partial [Gammaproteobacteria bacterium]|nr:glucose dehydrogenase [Gammaproteobacteria bacterium]